MIYCFLVDSFTAYNSEMYVRKVLLACKRFLRYRVKLEAVKNLIVCSKPFKILFYLAKLIYPELEYKYLVGKKASV